MKASTIAASFVALVAVIAACADGSGKTSPIPLGQARAITVSIGPAGAFRSFDVPISDRAAPTIATTDSAIIVFGGYATSDGRRVALDDGAISSDRGRQWTAIPDTPFAEALYQPGIAPVGEDFIVVGTPCKVTSLDLDLVNCTGHAASGASFSPAEGRWRSLPAFKVPSELGAPGQPLMLAGLGAAGGNAVFEVEAGVRRVLLLVDPTDGATTVVSAPDRVDAICPSGESILAVATGEDMGGFMSSSNEEAIAQPVRTWRLEVASRRWTELTPASKPASRGAMFERISCSAGAVAYFPVLPAPVGFGQGILWFDRDSLTWTSVPDAGQLGYPGEMVVAQTGRTTVMWQLGDSAFWSRTADGPWVSDAKPAAAMGAVRLHGLADAVVIDPSGANPEGPVRLTTFTPASVAPTGS